jgi:hypothetical protein
MSMSPKKSKATTPHPNLDIGQEQVGRLREVHGTDSLLEPWPQSANQPLAPMGVPVAILGQ